MSDVIISEPYETLPDSQATEAARKLLERVRESPLPSNLPHSMAKHTTQLSKNIVLFLDMVAETYDEVVDMGSDWCWVFEKLLDDVGVVWDGLFGLDGSQTYSVEGVVQVLKYVNCEGGKLQSPGCCNCFTGNKETEKINHAKKLLKDIEPQVAMFSKIVLGNGMIEEGLDTSRIQNSDVTGPLTGESEEAAEKLPEVDDLDAEGGGIDDQPPLISFDSTELVQDTTVVNESKDWLGDVETGKVDYLMGHSVSVSQAPSIQDDVVDAPLIDLDGQENEGAISVELDVVKERVFLQLFQGVCPISHACSGHKFEGNHEIESLFGLCGKEGKTGLLDMGESGVVDEKDEQLVTLVLNVVGGVVDVALETHEESVIKMEDTSEPLIQFEDIRESSGAMRNQDRLSMSDMGALGTQNHKTGADRDENPVCVALTVVGETVVVILDTGVTDMGEGNGDIIEFDPIRDSPGAMRIQDSLGVSDLEESEQEILTTGLDSPVTVTLNIAEGSVVVILETHQCPDQGRITVFESANKEELCQSEDDRIVDVELLVDGTGQGGHISLILKESGHCITTWENQETELPHDKECAPLLESDTVKSDSAIQGDSVWVAQTKVQGPNLLGDISGIFDGDSQGFARLVVDRLETVTASGVIHQIISNTQLCENFKGGVVWLPIGDIGIGMDAMTRILYDLYVKLSKQGSLIPLYGRLNHDVVMQEINRSLEEREPVLIVVEDVGSSFDRIWPLLMHIKAHLVVASGKEIVDESVEGLKRLEINPLSTSQGLSILQASGGIEIPDHALETAERVIEKCIVSHHALVFSGVVLKSYLGSGLDIYEALERLDGVLGQVQEHPEGGKDAFSQQKENILLKRMCEGLTEEQQGFLLSLSLLPLDVCVDVETVKCVWESTCKDVVSLQNAVEVAEGLGCLQTSWVGNGWQYKSIVDIQPIVSCNSSHAIDTARNGLIEHLSSMEYLKQACRSGPGDLIKFGCTVGVVNWAEQLIKVGKTALGSELEIVVLIEQVLLGLGLTDPTVEFAQTAVNFCEEKWGKHHKYFLPLALNLAIALERANKNEEALVVLKTVESCGKVRNGEWDVNSCTFCAGRLGELYFKEGSSDKAETAYRSVLSTVNEDNARVLAVWEGLGPVLEDSGHVSEIVEMAENGVNHGIAIWAESHPMLAGKMHRLGSAVLRRGMLQEAEVAYTKSLDMWIKLVGLNDLNTATVMNELAHVVDFLGDSQRAEELLRQALEVRRGLFGDNDKHVASTMNDLACVLTHKGDYETAVAMHRNVLKIKQGLYGNAGPKVLTSMGNLASALERLGDLEEVESLRRGVLAGYEEIHGSDHAQVAESLTDLARVLEHQGSFQEAEVTHRRALQIWENLYGDRNCTVATAMGNVANVLEAQRDLVGAEKLYRKAVEIMESLGGEVADLTMAGMLNNLALVLEEQGKFPLAEDIHRKALPLWRRTRGEGHPDVAISMTNLAMALEEQGQFEEAEMLHRKSLGVWKQVGDEAVGEIANSMDSLASVLEHLERMDDAEEMRVSAMFWKQKYWAVYGTDA